MKSVGDMLLGNKPSGDALGALLGSLVALVILLFLGEYLWNHVLAKVVSVVKPVNSIWQILGLKILFGLLLC